MSSLFKFLMSKCETLCALHKGTLQVASKNLLIKSSSWTSIFYRIEKRKILSLTRRKDTGIQSLLKTFSLVAVTFKAEWTSKAYNLNRTESVTVYSWKCGWSSTLTQRWNQVIRICDVSEINKPLNQNSLKSSI